jgi:hypothetical protein
MYKLIFTLPVIILSIFFFTNTVNAAQLLPTSFEVVNNSKNRDQLSYPFVRSQEYRPNLVVKFTQTDKIESVYIFSLSSQFECKNPSGCPFETEINLDNWTEVTTYFYEKATKSNCSGNLQCYSSEVYLGGKEGIRSHLIFIKYTDGNTVILSSKMEEITAMFKQYNGSIHALWDIGLFETTEKYFFPPIPVNYLSSENNSHKANKFSKMDLTYYVDKTRPNFVQKIEDTNISDGIESYNRNFPLNFGDNLAYVTYKDKFRIKVKSEKYQNGLMKNYGSTTTATYKLVSANQNCIRQNPDKISEGLIVKFGEICEFIYEGTVTGPRTMGNDFYLYYKTYLQIAYEASDLAGNFAFETIPQPGGGGSTRFQTDMLILNIGEVDENKLFRFWSESNKSHFYTKSGLERDMIRKQYSEYIWKYEGVAYTTPDCSIEGVSTVYRFWSNLNKKHFYTNSLEERNHVINAYDDNEWLYEGEAFCAYNSGGGDKLPVYRFWSNMYKGHFYTSSEDEKNEIMRIYSTNEWKLEGVAYYVSR